MQSLFMFHTKLITIVGSALLLQIPAAVAQKPADTTDLKIIRSTSSMIDNAVESDLVSNKLKPFRIVDDATFLRRSYIGIVGRIPTYQETTTFFNNRDKDKRADLIDSLVYSPGYESKTFNFWADMLRLHTNSEQYGLGWHVWLRQSVTENKPYNKMVHEMLSASGHASKNPAVGYYLRDRGMLLDNISNTVQVFLGTQIGCAQCHDHPFEDWTQKQYYQLAAFGANIDYKSNTAREKIMATAIHVAKKEGIPEIDPKKNNNQGKKNKKRSSNNVFNSFVKKTSRDIQSLFKQFQKNEISVNNTKTLKLPNDYQYNDGDPGDIVAPKPLFEDMPDLHQGPNKLENFANWVTDPKNPQFTKNIANRLWQHVFGYGLAEPLDNWTDRTKVSHPEALAIVEKILQKNNYNIRETLRILYHTQLYQRTVSKQEVEPGSTYAFQGPILRRLTAEELYDSFLTLEKGNLDAQKNHTFVSKWNDYTSGINSLLTSSPENLMKLDDITDQTEKKVYELQAKARKLKLEVSKATGEGQKKKADKLQKELKETYAQVQAVKNKASTMAAMSSENPSMTASMIQMTSNNNLRVRSKAPLRASEMPSPSNGGSFLRMFGASDRQTPDAAHSDASIPQTLTLLNGKDIRAVADKKGTLPSLLSKASSSTEKLNILFLTVYSRYPTSTEHQKYQPLMEDNKQTEVLAKAMLNSKRFLFVQ